MNMGKGFVEITKLIVVLQVSLLLLVYTCKGQSSIFCLKDVSYRSDLNYAAIENIDEYLSDALMDSVFNVQAGTFTIYRFERVSKNPEFKDNREGRTESRELIIAKVDQRRILVMYYFPLDWREYPISSVLLVSQKEVSLTEEISTEEMTFRPVHIDGVNVLKNGVIAFRKCR